MGLCNNCKFVTHAPCWYGCEYIKCARCGIDAPVHGVAPNQYKQWMIKRDGFVLGWVASEKEAIEMNDMFGYPYREDRR